MDEKLKTNADKFSFIIAELKGQSKTLGSTHTKVEFIHERLFIRRNNRPSLEAQVDANTKEIEKRGNRTWEVVKLFIAPIIAAVITAIVILSNLPQ